MGSHIYLNIQARLTAAYLNWVRMTLFYESFLVESLLCFVFRGKELLGNEIGGYTLFRIIFRTRYWEGSSLPFLVDTSENLTVYHSGIPHSLKEVFLFHSPASHFDAVGSARSAAGSSPSTLSIMQS